MTRDIILQKLAILHNGEELLRQKAHGMIADDDRLQLRLAVTEAAMDLADTLRQFNSSDEDLKVAEVLMVPPELARRFGELAAGLAPAPAAPMQRAVAEFLGEGHYLRHLRRMKRLYAARREALLRSLREVALDSIKVQATPGLAVVTVLPEFASDLDIASRARKFGLAPAPLSRWYM
jgi:hypothetical protein